MANISRSEAIVRYICFQYCSHIKVKVNGTERTFHYDDRHTTLKEYLEGFENEDITLELSWEKEFKIEDWLDDTNDGVVEAGIKFC